MRALRTAPKHLKTVSDGEGGGAWSALVVGCLDHQDLTRHQVQSRSPGQEKISHSVSSTRGCSVLGKPWPHGAVGTFDSTFLKVRSGSSG